MIAKQKALNLKAFEEVPPGFEPGIEVLQTFALPLGYGAETTDVIISRIVPFVKAFYAFLFSLLSYFSTYSIIHWHSSTFSVNAPYILSGQ